MLQPLPLKANWPAVEEARTYRERAAHCRELALAEHDPAVAMTLWELADDLEDEADRLDNELPG